MAFSISSSASDIKLKSEIDIFSSAYPYETAQLTWKNKGNALIDLRYKNKNFNLFGSVKADFELQSSRGELYLWENYIDIDLNQFIFKAGQQIIHWSDSVGLAKADIINPTDFRLHLNPLKAQEKIPMPMVSLKYLGTAHNFEMILIPGSSNNWYADPEDQIWRSLKKDYLVKTGTELEINLEQIPRHFEYVSPAEYGLRWQNMADGFDWSGFYFVHYDRVPVFIPTLTSISPLSVFLDSQFFMTQVYGLTFSKTLSAHVFRSDLLYFPSRHVNLIQTDKTLGHGSTPDLIFVFGADLDFQNQWKMGLQLSTDFYMNSKHVYLSRSAMQNLLQLRLSRLFFEKYEFEFIHAYEITDLSYSLNYRFKWDTTENFKFFASWDYFNGSATSEMGRLSHSAKWTVGLESQMEWLND